MLDDSLATKDKKLSIRDTAAVIAAAPTKAAPYPDFSALASRIQELEKALKSPNGSKGTCVHPVVDNSTNKPREN